MTYSEEDIATNTMNPLSATSVWILVRHQWLMRKNARLSKRRIFSVIN